jgi:Yip1 domain
VNEFVGSFGDRGRASARIGLILRSVLAHPRTGFEAAMQAERRRARTGAGPVGRASRLFFSLAGGVSGMVLWLKVAGMAELREPAPRGYSWTLVVFALALGALVAPGAQILWSVIAARAAALWGGEARPQDLRVTWGIAAFPQLVTVLVLLPLDLLFLGTDVFAARPLGDSLGTVWASVSIAFALAIGVWSALLLFSGVQVVTGLGRWRSLGVLLLAVVSVAIVAGACLLLAVSIETLLS